MVTIVIRKNLVKKAAGVSVACALTIGMNVVIAGPEESTLFQQMGLIKTAAGAEVTNATVAPAIAPTPISINNQKRVTLNQVVSDEFVGPMLPSATPTTTPFSLTVAIAVFAMLKVTFLLKASAGRTV